MSLAEREDMTIEEAIKILHPGTTKEALLGYGKEDAIKLVEEACILACECMEKQIEKKVINYEKCLGNIEGKCQSCGETYSFKEGDEFNYCPECGQRLDWQTDLEVKTDG